MRLVSKKFTCWLNIWLIFSLVGSLLLPISLASASSSQTGRMVLQNNGSLVRESQANSENDTTLAINGLTGQEAVASNNQSPVQLNGATPRTFSLPFNSNVGKPRQKSVLSPLLSEWSNPIPISSGQRVALAIRNNWAYAVWDILYNNIFLARSADGGQNWNPTYEQVTAYDYEDPQDPAIVVDPSNGTIYVVYLLDHEEDNRTTLEGVRSNDNGQTWFSWSPPVFIPLNTLPNVAIDNSGNLYLSWATAEGETKLTRSTNSGQTWSPEFMVENNLNCGVATDSNWIAASGNGVVYIVWFCGQQVRVTKSVDGGQTWVDKPALRDNPNVILGKPVIALDGPDKVYVAWKENLLINDVFFAASQDGGDIWSNPLGISSATTLTKLDMGVRSNGQLVLGWNGDNALHIAESNNHGQQWSIETLATSIQTFDLDADPVTGAAVVAWTTQSGQTLVTSSAGNTSPLILDILDPDGSPVTQLTLNADGWPTPNPLTVQVTLSCPAGGANCIGPLNLTLASADNPRFIVYAREEIDKPANTPDLYCAETTTGSTFSYQSYEASCPYRGSEAVHVPFAVFAGETKVVNWYVWIQPSETASLNFTATWETGNASRAIQIQEANIRPLVILPGFGGTFPPQHGGKPDPLLHTYDNLIEALQRAGYELGTPNSGATLIPLGYDWRIPFGETGQDTLAGDIQTILDVPINTRKPYADDYTQVDIIAHSAGGLVARAFIEDADVNNQEKVNRLITVATPHQGMPKAYPGWYGGDFSVYGIPSNAVLVSFLRAIALCDGYNVGARPFWAIINSPIFSYNYIRDKMKSVENALPVPGVEPAYLIRNEAPADAYPYPQEYPEYEDMPQNTFLADLNANNGSNVGEYDINKLTEVSVIASFSSNVDTPLQYRVNPRPPAGPLVPTYFWSHGEVVAPIMIADGDETVPTYSGDLSQVINFPKLKVYNENSIDALDDTFNPTHLQIIDGPDVVRRIISRTIGIDISANEAFWNGRANTPYIDIGVLLVTCSPIRTLVTDSQGRRAGLNSSNGQIINEIPGAVVTDDGTEPHLILLPETKNQYQVKAVGIASGDYQLGILQIMTATNQIIGGVLSGTTTFGQNHGFAFEPSYFQESGGQVTLEAEHFIWSPERSQRNWITQTTLSGYTGTAYLSALPDTDLQFTSNYPEASPNFRLGHLSSSPSFPNQAMRWGR